MESLIQDNKISMIMRADGEIGENFLLAKFSTYIIHSVHVIVIPQLPGIYGSKPTRVRGRFTLVAHVAPCYVGSKRPSMM